MADHKPTEERIHLSDTEAQLIQDNDGSYRDQLLNQLFTEATRLKQLREQGVSPDEFNKIDSLLTAVVSAMEVVDKSWQQNHSSNS